MGFRDSVRTCFRKYVAFRGRASRPEFWWFILFTVLVGTALSIVDAVLFDPPAGSPVAPEPLYWAFQLVVLVPTLSVSWRRLQDSGRSGWLVLPPFLFTLAFSILVLTGVAGSWFIEGSGDPVALRGLAASLGVSGLLVLGLVQIPILILVIWWFTRPSEPRHNAYGPMPA